MDAGFCIDALTAALRKYGKPKFFNTDQGRPFTGYDFTGVLKDAKVNTSTDGQGRRAQLLQYRTLTFAVWWSDFG